ncbi:Aldo/keto reductase [Zopfia rhizophila CBS 207.26]|uniref:Aldo/keto reductase n=1 Tax=Zopfia rhizophila CBS 207.26 TaxID=1314779 RepID=A0A6A6DSX7_9PEZI|nr:Aldo/keto reductase [Zopfia rhizophila CBS 207.26]
MLDIFQAHGHNEVDTAGLYGGGSSEEMLAKLDFVKRGIIMDTKLYPNAGLGGLLALDLSYNHKPIDVRRGLLDSLKVLNTPKIDMFYLHGPDRNTPYEDTLREANALYKEGYFTRFGISNYMSWEVAQICEICIRNDWIRPTVYQGVYHALQRRIEDELFPCLRYYNIALYAFQPLAGGFLTGRYTRGQNEFEPGSRFDPKIAQGAMHRGRYWNDSYFDALDEIKAAADKHGLTLAEVAMRWLVRHSQMRKELGDAVIIGASSTKHLEQNLADLEKGPLPEDVVEVLESVWPKVKGVAPKYWH